MESKTVKVLQRANNPGYVELIVEPPLPELHHLQGWDQSVALDKAEYGPELRHIRKGTKIKLNFGKDEWGDPVLVSVGV
jgi:hypothetical protein